MKIRKAKVADMFYNGNQDILEDDISGFFYNVRPEINPTKIFGIIAPHAGYVYSGQTAAYAYKYLQERKFKTVIVISPSHREFFNGSCIFDGDAYETPFGVVEVDKELRDKMLKCESTLFAGENGHKAEHALEVQLPFLQYILGDFKLLPIVVGNQQYKYVDDLALQVSKIYNDEILIVASTDLSHFHNKNEAERLDSQVENCITEFDYEKLIGLFEKNSCEACGGGLIFTIMKCASLCGFTQTQVLNRVDSSHVSGNEKEVVGYLSALIYE